MEKTLRFQGEKEKRGIVGHRSDVVAVVPRECFGTVALDQSGKRVRSSFRRGIQKLQRRIIAQVLSDCLFLFRSKRALLCENSHGNPVLIQLALGYNEEIPGHTRHSELMEGLHSN